jgi:hypothetical protein
MRSTCGKWLMFWQSVALLAPAGCHPIMHSTKYKLHCCQLSPSARPPRSSLLPAWLDCSEHTGCVGDAYCDRGCTITGSGVFASSLLLGAAGIMNDASSHSWATHLAKHLMLHGVQSAQQGESPSWCLVTVATIPNCDRRSQATCLQHQRGHPQGKDMDMQTCTTRNLQAATFITRHSLQLTDSCAPMPRPPLSDLNALPMQCAHLTTTITTAGWVKALGTTPTRQVSCSGQIGTLLRM